MSTRYWKDPDADARSLMMARPSLCDGQATGFKCVHYWSDIARMDSQNSDELKMGEKFRRCTLVDGPTQNIDAVDMSVYCDRYEPSRRSLLHPLRQTRRYDPDFDTYEPLTEAEVAALRAAWQRRKDASAPFDAEAAVAQFRADVKAGLVKPEPAPALVANPDPPKEKTDG